MKQHNVTNSRSLILVLLVGLVGCVFPSRTEVRTPGEPYGMVDVSQTTDLVHTSTRGELYHWDKTGKKTLIWPSLSRQLLQTNDMALFRGYVTAGSSAKDQPTRSEHECLFAVKGAGPAVDITDDVIRLWAKSSGTNLSVALKRAYIPSVERKEDHFEIMVKLVMGSGGKVELSTGQILDMIRLAKEKGKPMKDPGFGTPYLKRDWEAESNKP